MLLISPLPAMHPKHHFVIQDIIIPIISLSFIALITSFINLSPNHQPSHSFYISIYVLCVGDPSYKQFRQEKDYVIESLKRRARKITDAFNSLEGVVCQETDGNCAGSNDDDDDDDDDDSVWSDDDVSYDDGHCGCCC